MMRQFSLVLLGALGCGAVAPSESSSEDLCEETEGCKLPKPPQQRQDLTKYRCPTTPPEDGIAVAFFDADSTIRVSKSGVVTATSQDDVNVLPFVAETIRKAKIKQKVLVAVVSNQGGVGKGHTPYEVAEGAIAYAASQIARLGAKVDYFDFAPDDDEFRKPNGGMGEKLDALLTEKCGVGINWSKSFMVGDSGYKKGEDGPHPDGRPADDFSNADRGFAETLGIPFSEPTDYFGWKAYETFNIGSEGDLVSLLSKIEVQGEALKETSPEESEKLLSSVRDLRVVNELE